MTPPKDTPADRRRHEAALDRLRAKGNHLAPVMVDGKVRPKDSSTAPTARGAGRGVTASEGRGRVIVRHDRGSTVSKPFPGDTFELLIPAPAEWLNANYRLNRWEKARRVKAWRKAAAWLAPASGMPQGLERLQIDAYVIKPIANNSDPANWQDTAKAVTDGLIDAGMAQDDNRKIVAGPFMHDGGKGEPALRIVVTVLAKGLLAS